MLSARLAFHDLHKSLEVDGMIRESLELQGFDHPALMDDKQGMLGC